MNDGFEGLWGGGGVIDKLEGLLRGGFAEGTDVWVVVTVLGVDIKTWTRYVSIVLGDSVMVAIQPLSVSMVTNMAYNQRLKETKRHFSNFEYEVDIIEKI